jgi:hypothetical protein
MLERKDCDILIVHVQFWPRVEMSRSFVLNELQSILYVGLCRIEMQPGCSKLRAQLWLGSLGLRAGSMRELLFGEAFDDILL